MADYLGQVTQICRDSDNAPFVVAGDVFDRWNSPAELINFAIKHMPPETYAIPGQHDLPYHSYRDIKRSAYWTLVEADAVYHVDDYTPIDSESGSLVLTAFAWGQKVEPLSREMEIMDGPLQVALVHAYLWKDGQTSYPGAPEASKVEGFQKSLRGYSHAFFGDNHKPFQASAGKCLVTNCGGFVRRKSDEVGHKPSVWILYNDGMVSRRFLDVSKDEFADVSDPAVVVANGLLDFSSFIEGLGDLGDTVLNFTESLTRYLDDQKVKESVRRIILDALKEDGK